jgi:hypothetical protein
MVISRMILKIGAARSGAQIREECCLQAGGHLATKQANANLIDHTGGIILRRPKVGHGVYANGGG